MFNCSWVNYLLKRIDSMMFCMCSVQFVDLQKFYLPLDTSLLLDMIKTDIQYLGASWKMMGRPLMVIPIRKSLLGLFFWSQFFVFMKLMDQL